MISRKVYVAPIGVAGVVAVGAAIAYFAARPGRAPLGFIELAAIASAAVALLVNSNRLSIGLAMLPLVAAALPFYLATGTQSVLVAALLLAGFLLALWVVESVFTRQWLLAESPVNVPTIALMFMWVFSTIYGQVVRSPLTSMGPTFLISQIGGLAVFLVSAGILLLAAKLGRNQYWIELATWGLIAVGTYATVAGGLSLLGISAPISFLNTSGLFTTWFVSLAFGQALFNERLRGSIRLILVLLVCGWMVKAMIVDTVWLSGWLPAAVTLGALTWMRSRRAFLVFLIIAAIVMHGNWNEIYDAVFQSNVNEGSGERANIAAQALEVFAQHPLFGTGPAGYAVEFMNLYRDSPFSKSTHSNYLDILLQTGILGAVIFIWFLVAAFKAGLAACRNWSSGFAAAFSRSALCSLLGILVAMSLGDWFIPFVYNQTIAGFRHTVHSWVFLGFLVSLGSLGARPRPIEIR